MPRGNEGEPLGELLPNPGGRAQGSWTRRRRLSAFLASSPRHSNLGSGGSGGGACPAREPPRSSLRHRTSLRLPLRTTRATGSGLSGGRGPLAAVGSTLLGPTALSPFREGAWLLQKLFAEVCLPVRP